MRVLHAILKARTTFMKVSSAITYVPPWKKKSNNKYIMAMRKHVGTYVVATHGTYGMYVIYMYLVYIAQKP